jgi:hypothetical protein
MRAFNARNYEVQRVRDGQARFSGLHPLIPRKYLELHNKRPNAWRMLLVMEVCRYRLIPVIVKAQQVGSLDHQTGRDNDGCYIVIT